MFCSTVHVGSDPASCNAPEKYQIARQIPVPIALLSSLKIISINLTFTMSVFSKLSAVVAPLLLAVPAIAGSIKDVEHVILFMQGRILRAAQVWVFS